MKRLVVSMLLLLQASLIFAQNVISGKVVDGDNAPVGFATLVLTKPDGSIVCGASADSTGCYRFSAPSGEFRLKAALVGYKDSSVDLKITYGLQQVPDIALEEDTQMLEGAAVQAVMPKTTLTAEGLQTSVRGTVLEKAGTANDVLEKTPGLIMGQNGLEVIGKGAPLVYINGRKINDKKELDRLQSTEIQSIEVIMNPGPQYDASVHSVVRIKTFRREGDGFGFDVMASDRQSLQKPYNNDPDFNFDANYRIKNVDIFAGVHFDSYKDFQDSQCWQQTLGTPKSVQEGPLRSDYSFLFSSVSGGVNWQIADNHSVGAKVEWFQQTKYGQTQTFKEDLYVDDIFQDHVEAFSQSSNPARKPDGIEANAYYNGTAGKLGIDLNIDWFLNREGEESLTTETSQTAQGATVSSNSSTRYSLYAAKLVLSYPIWKGKLSIGNEDTFTRNNEEYNISGAEDINSSLSNLKENNIAAFANYAFGFDKVGRFSVGVRYEHVDYAYENEKSPESNITRKYDNFFPSASYSGSFGPVQLMLNYGVKTERPGFYLLSNAVRYNSRYVRQSGDATLQPQIHNEAGLTVMWKFLSLMVNYSRIDNDILTWSEIQPDNVTVLVKPRNISEPCRSLSTFLTATPTVGIWNLNGTIGLTQQWLNITAGDRVLSFNDKPMFFCKLYNTFTVKGGWQFEIGGEYRSPSYYENLYLYNHYFNLKAAVQKSFLKDGSLVLRLEGSDLTRTANFNVKTDFGQHIIDQTSITDRQRIRLSLRYSFNTADSKYKGRGAGQDARGRMSKGQ